MSRPLRTAEAIRSSSILSLDIATRTGWALWQDGRTQYGLAQFPVDLAEFALRFDEWLAQKIASDDVGKVYVEAPIPARGKTNQNVLLRAHGAHVIARKVCLALNVEFESVSPDRWRKFFIGTARAPRTGMGGTKLSSHHRRKWLKEAALAQCKKLGWTPDNDDVADALGLLAYAKSGESGHVSST